MNKLLSLRMFHVIFIVLVAALLGYIIGSRKVSMAWSGYKPLNIESNAPKNTEDLDMSLFYEVLDKVNSDYYDTKQIDSQKIVDGAVAGMLQSLDDPYTSYFPPKENASFKEQMAGKFEGIGAELSLNDDSNIIVIAPIDGSPAQRAGIKAGDIIAEVNGDSTRGWTLPQAIEKIRGPKGSTVTLSVLHEKAKELTDVKITRDVINIKSVTGWVKNMNCSGSECVEVSSTCSSCKTVAYIRLSQFGDQTNKEWVETVNTITSQTQTEATTPVILDLRNNPGGYLPGAVFIASEFITEGDVLLQEDGKGNKQAEGVSRRGLLTNKAKYPVYVLLNKGSASASEIVAGALRDNNRAKLVGETSFGKGTVQQAVDIGNKGASVHLSVAKWLTPNGTWVHKKGLKPDTEIKFDATKSASMKIDNQLNQLIKSF